MAFDGMNTRRPTWDLTVHAYQHIPLTVTTTIILTLVERCSAVASEALAEQVS